MIRERADVTMQPSPRCSGGLAIKIIKPYFESAAAMSLSLLTENGEAHVGCASPTRR
jgi:hypothetical protein